MKICKALAASLGYLLLLAGVYLFHIRYFKVDVVLYSSLLDVALASVMAAGALYQLSFFSGFSHLEKLQMVIIWLLAGCLVAITIPTVIDRSLSFYILEKLEQSGGAMPLRSFERAFTKGYAKEHRLVESRLTEQLESGTVILQGDCVRLTERGRQLAGFGSYFRQNLLPRKRLLMGEYSDFLTRPLREGDRIPADECR